MTGPHQAEVTIRLIERWPAHEPRESDPHYKLFHQAKERMRRQGLLKCNVRSDYHYGQIELHHNKVEFAHINDIDLDKFNAAYGLDLTDEQFAEYVEQEGNLEPLCTLHHRGQEGVHSLPEPEWNVLRTSKDPQQVITALSNTEIGVVPPPAS
ncbi:MAG TPA: hypothetical protein VMB51_05220 [Solirubrobacteraceae bacterium]|nr:hypothetical protein [Solirubrobacteraceae bacterium]